MNLEISQVPNVKSQLITPPNVLRQKLGGKLPAADADALARAEMALQALSGQFQEWMEDEVNKLVAAHVAAKAAGLADEQLNRLYGHSHDVKGLAGTYEYPAVTRLANSLCRLIETPEARKAARTQPALIDAHVEAVRLMVRDQIKPIDHPVAVALMSELESRTLKLLASAAKD